MRVFFGWGLVRSGAVSLVRAQVSMRPIGIPMLSSPGNEIMDGTPNDPNCNSPTARRTRLIRAIARFDDAIGSDFGL